MPAPTQPTLTLSRLSSTSFRAAITGDAGATHRLYYRLLNVTPSNDITASTRVGNGNIDAVGLTASSQVMAWIVSDNGEFSLPRIGFISLVVSDTLLAAVKTQWYSTPTLLTAAGKLFANEVPERDESGNLLELPYTYMHLSRTRIDFTFESEHYEYSTIEFNTFAAGAEAAEAARQEIRTTFDWKNLPFTSSSGTLTTTIMAVPTDYEITEEHIRYKDGSMVYRSQMCYEVCVERNYPE